MLHYHTKRRTLFLTTILVLAMWTVAFSVHRGETAKGGLCCTSGQGCNNAKACLSAKVNNDAAANHSNLTFSNDSALVVRNSSYSTTSIMRNKDGKWTLGFTIAGFPKTGTSFLARWLPRHPNICMPNGELRGWKQRHGKDNDPQRAIAKSLAAELQESSRSKARGKANCKLWGYKSPSQVRSRAAMTLLSKEWPRAGLVVGVRHPVWWFESFYNFRSRPQEKHPVTLPPEQLRGGVCDRSVCTDQANFHIFLSYLGKTNLSSPAEMALLNASNSPSRSAVGWDRKMVHAPPVQNKVFLYEASQLNAVENSEVFETLRRDLSRFLYLSSFASSLNPLLPPMADASKEDHRYNKTFDICEPRYQALREELVDIGSHAASWIQDHFISLPHVETSSPWFLGQKLKEWRNDPCVAGITKRTNQKH